MPTVYVTQENQGLDYTPAEEYGEVKFITRKEWSPIRGSLLNDELLREIKHTLTEFRPDEDYFVVSGSPTVAAAVFTALGRMRLDGGVRLLRWSNRDRVYQPVHLDV